MTDEPGASTPSDTPPSTPSTSIDIATLQQVADLAWESLKGTLGSLGRPSVMEIANALWEALEPYDHQPPPTDQRYSTLAILDGRLMVVMDHQAWAYQCFTVTSPACPLPGSPPTSAQPPPPSPQQAAVDGVPTAAKE
jgi:hypothetical protein